MEDLQDAIADARYMGERVNQKLEPLVPLKWPSSEELASFRATALSEDPACFSFETITSQPAGMYFFLSFAREIEPNAGEMLAMLEDINQFKLTLNLRLRLFRAKEMFDYYLSGMEGNHKRSESNQKTGFGSVNAPQTQVNSRYSLKRGISFSQMEMIKNREEIMKNAPKAMNDMDEGLDFNPARNIEQCVQSTKTPSSFKQHDVETKDEEEPQGASAGDETEGNQTTKEQKEASGAQEGSQKKQSQNRVGAKEELVEKIKALIQEEVELEERLKDAYGMPEAGIHFCGFNPSLFDDVTNEFLKKFRKIEGKFLKDETFSMFLAIKWMEKQRVGINNFASYRIIGRGGFGEVYAQKRVETGKMYAVKLLQKGTVKQKKAEDLCWNEMKALQICRSPFVVNLKYAFQTKQELFLVLDLMSGGDLCFHLNKSPNGRFPPDQARFHAAEILLGLRHLHEQGYVYRDLKPDNVLLNDQGHCKISDLGLAIQRGNLLVGTAGTLGYMPPEMFRRNEEGEYDPHGQKTPYDHSVDWWSFGCVVFEMLVGKCPFRTTGAKKYYEELFGKPCPGGNSLSYRYATCSMPVEYTSSVFQSPDGQLAADLIMGCLNRNPAERLGSSELLFHQLKNHAWFTSALDMNMVAKQQVRPPFIPKRNEINAESIREIKRDAQKRETAKLTPQDQERWENWYFFSNEAFQEEVVELMEYEIMNGKIEFHSENLKFCSIL